MSSVAHRAREPVHRVFDDELDVDDAVDVGDDLDEREEDDQENDSAATDAAAPATEDDDDSGSDIEEISTSVSRSQARQRMTEQLSRRKEYVG